MNMPNQIETPKKIRIVVSDAETGAVLHDDTTTRAMYLADVAPESKQMMVKYIALGEPEYVVSLLNVAIQRQAEAYGIRAYVIGNAEIPYFDFKKPLEAR